MFRWNKDNMSMKSSNTVSNHEINDYSDSVPHLVCSTSQPYYCSYCLYAVTS